MNMQQHMNLVGQIVGRAFVDNGLYVHILQTIQGPHTLSVALTLYQPTKGNVDKAMRLDGAVEATLGDGPVRIDMDRGVIMVEVPSPQPVTVYGKTLRGQGLAIPVGMTARQTITGIDFETDPHLLVVGPTGKGKTVAQRNVAYQLACQNPPRYLRFIVSTFKPKDWSAFAPLAHTWAVITTPAESAQMIKHLHRVMFDRTANGISDPHIVIFLDDLLNLLGCVDVVKELVEIASLGRAAGLHLVLGTQRLGKRGAGDAAITGNIPTRLVFGTASATDAAQFTGHGKSGAEKLGRYPGDALLITDGGTERVATAYVDDGDLVTLKQLRDEYRPWLSSRVTPSSQSITSGRRPDDTIVTRDALPPNLGKSGNIALVPSCVTPLPDREPDTHERAYLRRLHEKLGSKRATMRAAWGGVVNEDGNTPKTRRWLDNALSEVLT